MLRGRVTHARERRVGNAAADRGHGATALAAIVAERHLMVMQSTRELCLVQMSGDVFVGHLVVASAQKIGFLAISV